MGKEEGGAERWLLKHALLEGTDWGNCMKQKPIELMHYSFGASAGNQCGSCCNLREYQYNSKRVRKCTAYGGLHSTKADWAKRWPACGLYGTPVTYQVVSDTAKRTFARIGICKDKSGPIEGQIGLEAIDGETD